ncbi:hypothetical protein [Sphingomonas sp.]|uniref:hypothetical protein n=1 Tax=Sphingomonas sp. TaxID=28214 RepID=UPI003B3BCBDE
MPTYVNGEKAYLYDANTDLPIGAAGLSGPGSTIATNQVAVTTSATQVVPARAGRQSITISSTSAVVFYLGGSGVTTSNGLYVAGSAGASITLATSAAVYAIGASAVTLSYIENY